MNHFDHLMREIRSRPGDANRERAPLSVVKRQAAGGRVHLMEDSEPTPLAAAPAPLEEPMAYEPRGKVGILADAMIADPGRIWSTKEVAKVMDVMQASVTAMLYAAIRNGAIHRRLENGKCQYSLRPFAAAPVPIPAPRIPVIGKDLKPEALTPQHGDETTRPAPPPKAAPTPAPSPAPTPAPAATRLLTSAEPLAAAALDMVLELKAKVDREPETVDEEAEQEVEFDACLWVNGELSLFGVQECVDGSVRLTTAQTAQLCRLLHGQGPAE